MSTSNAKSFDWLSVYVTPFRILDAAHQCAAGSQVYDTHFQLKKCFLTFKKKYIELFNMGTCEPDSTRLVGN